MNSIDKKSGMSKNLSFVVFCKVLNRICDVSVECNAHIFPYVGVVCFHSLSDPVKHDADKTVFIEICDKTFLLLCKGSGSCLLFDNTHDQVVGQLEEKIFNLFPADCIISIYNEGFVFVDCFKDLQKSFLPGSIGLFTLKCVGGFFEACPLDQIIDIFEMIIKSHAADSAVRGQIIDRDLRERFLEEKVFQRVSKSAFCDVGHGISTFLCSGVNSNCLSL